MLKKLIQTLEDWKKEKILDSEKLKKIHTAIEYSELIVYASIEFTLRDINNSTRIVIEKEKISLMNINENELKEKLDSIVKRISL